jgi:hypothetical protein
MGPTAGKTDKTDKTGKTGRDDLVKVGTGALLRDGLDVFANMGARAMTERVLDAVEHLIRADERRRSKPPALQHMQDRLDLIAEVMGLPDEHHYGSRRGGCVKRDAVLELIERDDEDEDEDEE